MMNAHGERAAGPEGPQVAGSVSRPRRVVECWHVRLPLYRKSSASVHAAATINAWRRGLDGAVLWGARLPWYHLWQNSRARSIQTQPATAPMGACDI